MSGFLGSSLGGSPPSTPVDMAARKEAVMNSVRNEIALTNAQELMNKANEKCFYKCITKPSTSLSGSEETCLSRCLDRYMQAFNIVSRTYVSRLSKERLEHRAE
ncbi:Tim10/DDP family zinc finger-domain-containing protein [Amylocystis lapponica]|nr:Tim10/DDP family zinc finger-domain-containing protein [Amylocystis lapponica]